MLPADEPAAAAAAAAAFQEPRIAHFYDAAWRAGSAVATSVGWPQEVAWDIYLFYPPGSRWADGPPRPVAWYHQLGAHQDDPAHFRCGPALAAQLAATLRTLQPGAAE